ncbi:hypothetical protein IQ283_08170 (plasmid) [Alkalihalobacillus hwajinpoensis]|uniref:hypothetical protein n=1 Tax=Guptibacillus hwajinpoensis TaxID=208199 RepID=UPI001883C725|nr:hypothetical protein [Pseudalkalibacillus hwajinpoensis]MBF0706584.1 hypothetical protein [Pseudalkalibacillus hwajinpoensis]
MIKENDINTKREIAYWTFFLKVNGKEVSYEYLESHNHICPTCRKEMKEKGNFFATLNPNDLTKGAIARQCLKCTVENEKKMMKAKKRKTRNLNDSNTAFMERYIWNKIS